MSLTTPITNEPTEDEILAAKKGAAFLDMFRPGWVEKVSLVRLDLSMGSSCVIGQVFGDYGTGVVECMKHDGYRGEIDERSDWTYEHGFMQQSEQTCDCGCGFKKSPEWSDWQRLTEAWKRLIRGRS